MDTAQGAAMPGSRMSVSKRVRAIKTIGAAKDVNELPYLKAVSIDVSEHPSVRRQALLQMGCFGARSAEAIFEVMENAKDEPTKKAAAAMMDALGTKFGKSEWSDHMKERLQQEIERFARQRLRQVAIWPPMAENPAV
jgi:hypothetical protein